MTPLAQVGNAADNFALDPSVAVGQPTQSIGECLTCVKMAFGDTVKMLSGAREVRWKRTT